MDDDTELLGLELDFWDDAVGAFEPAKVLRLLRRAFPDAEVDPTDHQQVRLLRELEFWSRLGDDPERRESLVRSSWGLYKTNGPTYRFVIPFPSGHRIAGSARRMSVNFWLPPDLPPRERERLAGFLRSLRLGEPTLDDGEEPYVTGA